MATPHTPVELPAERKESTEAEAIKEPSVPLSELAIFQATDDALLTASRRKLASLEVSDRQMRAAVESDEDRAFLARHTEDSLAFTQAAFERYAPRDFLATRTEGHGYTYQSFGAMWSRAMAVGAGLASSAHRQGAESEAMLRPGDMVGLLGVSSPEWCVSFFAQHQLGCVAVPLRSALRDEDIAYMISHAELALIFLTAEHKPQVMRVAHQCPKLRFVVLLDESSSATSSQGSSSSVEASVQVTSVAELQRRGETAVQAGWRFPKLECHANTLRALIYTSGSTGRPKAAMYTEHILLAILSRKRRTWPFLLLHYLPMNHVAGLLGLLLSLAKGGVCYFAHRPDMSSILEDARLARPTVVMMVPRMAELIVEEWEAACNRAGATDEQSRQAILDSMRTALGDRLLWLLVGTAPMSVSTMDFLVRCFGVPVLDGYGQTETGGMVTINGRILRDAVTDYKLVSVPELGYSVHDRPYPRGELRIKTQLAIPGYFKNDAASTALRDADGFLLSGDIVEERGPDTVFYIDRKSNVLKLSQGEFVSLSHIETVLAAALPLIKQIMAYASSTHSCVLAVIVPDMEAVRHALHMPPEGEVHPAQLKELLLSELSRVGSEAGFEPYEIPHDVLVEFAPWTVENELLTESKKLARSKLTSKYHGQLMEMYAQADKQARQAMLELKNLSLPITHRALRCAALVLGQDVAALSSRSTHSSFRALGGDSVSAVRLHTLLRDNCGASPSVAAILNASGTLEQIIEQVASIAAGSSGQRVDFVAIHGPGATVARAKDLDLTRFIEVPASDLGAPSDKPKHVLVTGANGFLGRFLLLELFGALEQMADHEYRATVLVRAANDTKARQRLRESFGSLAGEFDRLGDRVDVLAGDLMMPMLGLASPVYDRLCVEVDSILHNAALVNHALGYSILFEPNVLGTVEIMRFATLARRKSITFTSSVAVTALAQRATTENDTASKMLETVPITEQYASGYALSKWASEVQLEQLARAPYDIPVNIVRCSMLLASKEQDKQVNVSDFITRLIAGVVWTGLRPKSCYADAQGVDLHANGHSGRPHLDGLPVEVAAAGITATLLHPRTGFHLYHCVNPCDDGISLDTVVDWCEMLGYTLETLAPYDRWFNLYSQVVEALPAKVKQHTNATILFQWKQPAVNSGGARTMRNDRFNELLSKHTRFHEGVKPLDAAFVQHAIRQLVALEILPPPASHAAEKAK